MHTREQLENYLKDCDPDDIRVLGYTKFPTSKDGHQLYSSALVYDKDGVSYHIVGPYLDDCLVCHKITMSEPYDQKVYIIETAHIYYRQPECFERVIREAMADAWNCGTNDDMDYEYNEYVERCEKLAQKSTEHNAYKSLTSDKTVYEKIFDPIDEISVIVDKDTFVLTDSPSNL